MDVSEVIRKRNEFYKNGEAGKIFALYAPGSEFRKFFPNEDLYITHFEQLKKEESPYELKIFSEKINDDNAEVLYCESFITNLGIERSYYSKTKLRLIDGKWLIESEVREERH